LKQYISGADFRKMILSAAACIDNAKQEVNELNVFPVPDGDTGTNMSMTMGTAVTEISGQEFADIGKAADKVAGALLRGARGNSGVILSLLFRGISKSLKGKAQADGKDLAEALEEGVTAAYRAVMKPAEGTMLTVSRIAAQYAQEQAKTNPEAESVMEAALSGAKDALKETIHQNPVLQKAGVIDAGGMGFVIILEGMLGVLKGVEVAYAAGSPEKKDKANFGDFQTEDINFTYCTEFIVGRENDRDPTRLRAVLDSMGDSLVLVDDDEIIKVHVHTNNPGKALEEALLYGSLQTVKVENMRNQHSEQVLHEQEKDPASGSSASPAPAEKRYGFVAVCAGKGVEDVFRDLGADRLIRGGQTMNPSTQDILVEIEQTPSEIVFVFPNNKNIIMAAEQCVPLTQKQVVVIPTKSIPQGISALLSFDPELETSDNIEAMTEAAEHVRTGQITYAARDSEFDGMRISEGDYMALLDSRLLSSGRDLDSVIRTLAGSMTESGGSFVTIFYGEGVSEQEAENVKQAFAEACPEAELNLLYGGQPVYYYLISVE